MSGDANAAVQAVLDRLVAEGREIGIQICAYLGQAKIVDCWAGLADPADRKSTRLNSSHVD